MTVDVQRPVARPGPARRRRRSRRRATRSWGAVVVLVLAAAIAVVFLRHRTPVPEVGCAVHYGNDEYTLSTSQAQNAAIIAAVGVRKGLPDHAITVALATALQESKLTNLAGGDRDSVGLFQQRPSQGWGPATQLHDPNYAATAFYDRLAQLPGWETMPVTVAAQTIQRSAAPDAYARWETEARALAIALSGEVPAGLSCYPGGFTGAAPSPGELASAAAQEYGAPVLGVLTDEKRGWSVASWAVAHAAAYHVGSVAFQGRVWTARTGRWAPDPAAGLVVTVGP